MKKTKSEQSHVLQQRIIGRTFLIWIVYTAVFVACAVVFNGAIASNIGNWIADNTSHWIRYDPADYMKQYTYESLVDITVNRYANDTALLDYTTIDEVPFPYKGYSREPNASAAAGDAISDEAKGETTATRGPVLQLTFQADGVFQTIYLDEQALAWNAAMQSFEDFQTSSSLDPNSWVTVSEYPYGPFSARNLEVYNTFKQLKWPFIIIVYMIGCIILILMGFRRSINYFDKLTVAVGQVIADRNRPIELPHEMAIAQNELNNIRMEALADEHAAIAAEQRKNELVAYLAHDIRTPLTSVIGYLALLDEAPDLPEETRKRYIQNAYAKSERLETLINEFFEITRYNLQTISLGRSTVDVRLFLEQVADEFYPQATGKGLKVHVEAPQDASFFVDTDKLARALGNIVRNAIAYADEDTEVVIKAKLEEDEEQGERWVITVTDTGREISQANLSSIFDKFYREDNARNANSGGAGLGLAIAKEIISAHGGTIGAESIERTTTFSVTIPA